ncbi:MAG: permease prefix domain 1-containing protein [Pirellulales bacterium]
MPDERARPDSDRSHSAEHRQWYADTVDEMADHLRLSAEDAARAGRDANEAEQEALTRFGSPTRALVHCFWIQWGDRIMQKTLSAVLLTALTAAVVVLAIVGWQSRQTLATRLNYVSDQLVSLNESQQKLLELQSRTMSNTVSISGRAYLGTPDKPVANLEVMIVANNDRRLPDPEVEPDGQLTFSRYQVPQMPLFHRVVTTDGQGHYDSGPLEPGLYRVLFAPTDAQGEHHGEYCFVSDVQELYESGSAEHLDLNVLQLTSRVRIQWSPQLPPREPKTGTVGPTELPQFSITASLSYPSDKARQMAAHFNGPALPQPNGVLVGHYGWPYGDDNVFNAVVPEAHYIVLFAGGITRLPQSPVRSGLGRVGGMGMGGFGGMGLGGLGMGGTETLPGLLQLEPTIDVPPFSFVDVLVHWPGPPEPPLDEVKIGQVAGWTAEDFRIEVNTMDIADAPPETPEEETE